MNLPVKLLFSLDEIVAFQELRVVTFEAIRRSLALDGHCKSYEGAFQIQLPDYFDAERGAPWVQLRLDCYVLGPTRHYQWRGDTLGQAVAMAKADLATWIEELAAQEQDERAMTP